MATYDRDTLLKELRESVIEVHFTKNNGENRIMQCTLMSRLLPQEHLNESTDDEKTFHKVNPQVIACWDVQKGGWRSFRVDSVSFVQDVSYQY